jgi:hypothetical protein
MDDYTIRIIKARLRQREEFERTRRPDDLEGMYNLDIYKYPLEYDRKKDPDYYTIGGDGVTYHMCRGKFHNDDGPAIVYDDGSPSEWYFHGTQYEPDKYEPDKNGKPGKIIDPDAERETTCARIGVLICIIITIIFGILYKAQIAPTLG